MAGKRQHFIPRFVLEGFAHRRSETDTFCWVYRSSGATFESNTRNVGVEGYFYGDNIETALDEKITIEEQEQSKFLKRIREKSFIEDSEFTDCENLVLRLALRTQHARRSMLHAGEEIVSACANHFDDDEKLEKFFLGSLKSNPEYLRGALLRQLSENGMLRGLSNQDRTNVVKFLETLAPNLLLLNFDGFSNNFRSQLKSLVKLIPGATKDGHNKALSQNEIFAKKRKQIEGCIWSIQHMRNNSLILGDCVIWAVSPGKGSPAPLIWITNDVYRIVFPISHNQLLIGERGNDYKLDTAPEHINEISSSLSLDFAISSTRPDDGASWTKLLGTRTMEAISKNITDSKSSIRRLFE